MTGFFSKINELFDEVKQELTVMFAISLGIFLFILFFNPFELNNQNLNNQLLVVLGLAGIIYFMMVLFYVILPAALPGPVSRTGHEIEHNYMLGLLVWILSSVAFAFYIRYVGKVHLSMYLVFKAVIVCLTPPAILWLIKQNIILKQQLSALQSRTGKLQGLLNEQSKVRDPVKTVIESENKSEAVELFPADIILIRSADNYIELFYREDEQLKKKLLRNTLTNVENQLNQFPEFIRCHRTTLVNTGFIESLSRSYTGFSIKIKDHDIIIPVSRQYLLRIKELVSAG